MSLKNSNDTVRDQTRELPVCSIVHTGRSVHITISMAAVVCFEHCTCEFDVLILYHT